MCGICGRVNFDAESSVGPPLVKAMADTLYHRGPDDEGYYVSGQVGLGFRRLSIIDLETGHQPISNEDGSVWVVLNGEIYNYRELRGELAAKGHHLATKSDTEVIVHLYEEYGVGCLEKMRGMFAFALWDGRNRTLLLARDRVGIKPLYYAQTVEGVTFASEIKAILADPAISTQVRPEAIDRFLTFNYLPGADTLFRGILKLPPGSYLLVRGKCARSQRYWDLDFTTRPRQFGDAMEELDGLLKDAVQSHMVSDVPIGVLLSGGVDSAAVLNYATEVCGGPLSTFTLGFETPGVDDERDYARIVANVNGAAHYDLTISSTEFRDFLPAYVRHMEEPVCEPPGIALYYVSRLAKSHVTVLLSGEGGDEAFAGYQTYRNVLWIERLKRLLGPASPLLGRLLSMGSGLPHVRRASRYAPLLHASFEDYYFGRTAVPSKFSPADRERLYSKDFAAIADDDWSEAPLREALQATQRYDVVNRMLYVDSKFWLPDDLLVKADKMTMANSIELRVPLLDHRLLEFAASLPGHFKVRGVTTKYIAKKDLNQRVPPAILSRPKTGFVVPYDSWLRTDLRSWLADLVLDPVSLARGYFRRPAIENLLAENRATGRFSKQLFSLAVLELWHREYGPRCGAGR